MSLQNWNSLIHEIHNIVISTIFKITSDIYTPFQQTYTFLFQFSPTDVCEWSLFSVCKPNVFKISCWRSTGVPGTYRYAKVTFQNRELSLPIPRSPSFKAYQIAQLVTHLTNIKGSRVRDPCKNIYFYTHRITGTYFLRDFCVRKCKAKVADESLPLTL